MDRRVAFVTGASRGIGKACAVALARAGFDVAISARTVREGETREHSSTVARSNTKPLPGSLETTARLIEEQGREALVVPADLLDAASLERAAAAVLDRWGRADVLVNNGRYIGPGHMDLFLDTPIGLIEKQIRANVMAPLVLCRALLPAMIERGDGVVVNITSAAGFGTPKKPAGAGGWGMGYGVSKAAVHRVAGFLAVEYGDRAIRAFNVQPGFIATERIAADMAEFGFEPTGEPPEVVGAVVAWLATSPDAAALNGRNIEAQFFCAERNLLPGWDGPRPREGAVDYDLSAAELLRLEEGLLR